ncbi:30S ribosome-binding factor RbfA [Georgenia sp. EYE_87]|uniref:30S ribosome-binding factor RbfA n=1 Tax=Georgenia sp. EYE_87 TaxID=2853448 RepID=UPI0027E2D269|nr:30S ribosome-binding factor RbfA [Georgenia sp. EYE_87]MCK6212371.1 30S ribosome-binding factor RbfA [Georgenia sp. EYE_87]
MADAPRARRLAERIQQIVARMLDTRIKDPRLGFVTVTDVRVTGDLQNATVFYTVLGSDEERAASAAALASAKGLIRSEVGKQTGIRLTPTLEFVPDAVPETAASLEEALREAAARDARLAEMAASASYAGEADPYRRPGEEEDLDEESGDLDVGELEDALGDAVEAPDAATDRPGDAVTSPGDAVDRTGDEPPAAR